MKCSIDHSMKREQILDTVFRPPTQEWVDSALEWVLEHPAEDPRQFSDQRRILEQILYSRHSRKRANRIRQFIYSWPNNFPSIELLVYIDSVERFRKVLDSWLPISPDNIALWISQAIGSRRRHAVTERDVSHALQWLTDHTDHEKRPRVISALLHVSAEKSTFEFAINWLRDRPADYDTLEVLTELLRAESAYESIAMKHVEQSICDGQVQEWLALLIRENRAGHWAPVIDAWKRVPSNQRSGMVLAALLATQPANDSLEDLTRLAIEEEWPDATFIVIELVKTTCRPELKLWAQQWLIEKVKNSACTVDGDFTYIPALVDVARILDDKSLLDVVPFKVWQRRDLRIGAMALSVFHDARIAQEAWKLIDKHPDAGRSFTLLRKLAKYDDEAAVRLKQWLAEATLSYQIIDGLFALLSGNSSDAWAMDHLREWIVNEVGSGWAVSNQEVTDRIRLQRHFPQVAAKFAQSGQ